jgi:hypothetical protein
MGQTMVLLENILGACCTTSLLEEIFHLNFLFITIFGLGFYKSLGTVVIHIN